jgi:hypothetical protein
MRTLSEKLLEKATSGYTPTSDLDSRLPVGATTPSQGTSAGKVDKVRRSVFSNRGTLIGRIRTD